MIKHIIFYKKGLAIINKPCLKRLILPLQESVPKVASSAVISQDNTVEKLSKYGPQTFIFWRYL